MNSSMNFADSAIYALDSAMGDEPDHEEMSDREIEEVNCQIEKLYRPLHVFHKSQSS